MIHAWFDLTAGVAGDMILGALLDAGADVGAVQAAVDAVAPAAVHVEAREVRRAGQRATKADVGVRSDGVDHRRWATLRAELSEAPLAPQTRDRALAVFGRLADAEARVHGTTPDQVHFHEVGALDSIADIVGACEALRLLGVTSVSASAIALGSGRVRAAHGDLAVPVPAVAELMIGWRSAPVVGGGVRGHEAHDEHGHPQHHHEHPAPLLTPDEPGELATPTGVAWIRALASVCEPLPALTVGAIGVGAGGLDFSGRPNVVRVVLGEPDAAASDGDVVELQANVDDLDPRCWPGVLDACLAAGALDAWLVPIQMKKGRPGFTVHALATNAVAGAVGDVFLAHTTTLGLRQSTMGRRTLQRSFVPVEVLGLRVRVKIGSLGGRIVHAAAESADLEAAAKATGRPEAELAQRAAAAIVGLGLVPGAPVPAGPPDPA